MKLEGGERMVLKSLLDLQGDFSENVEDSCVAAATKMAVQDVRDWLEMLEGKGFVERTRLTDGFSAYVTAGKQALRLTEPISSPKPGGEAAPVVVSPGDKVSTLPQPEAAAPRVTGPIRLFYSYSHKDEDLRKELEDHLSLLWRQGVISAWHDRMIGAGEEWRGQLDKNLEEARIILLLVSSSFLASDYCWDIEISGRSSGTTEAEAKVIPIILRPCDWHGAPFGKLQALPKDGKAITSLQNWDEAFTDVVVGIRRAVETMRNSSA